MRERKRFYPRWVLTVRSGRIGGEITKLSNSFRCAFRGITLCVQTERNFRIHLCAALYVTVFACAARLNASSSALLCVCFSMMLGAELLNTAIERLCDRNACGYDGFVRDAKDIAAAAVFICALFCVVVGIILFSREAAVQNIITFFLQKLWALALLVLTLPFAAVFVFAFNKIK